MSEPTVTVVRRIHSLLNQKSEISESVKDKFEELLSSIDNLTCYLDHADENRLLTKTATRFENKVEKFIYKVTSESRVGCSFLRRFLVQMAHESEDVIDDIVNKVANERSGRYGFLKKYVCRPSFQIAPQQIQKIEGITKKLHKAKEDIEKFHVSEPKEKPTDQRLRKITSTTSYPHKIVGLQKVINSLVEKIIWSGNTESILYIVGTVGSGKTTLATEISNHRDIKEHFKSVVWASVSEKKDAKNIFLEILRKTQGKDEDAESNMITKELMNKICNTLKERPYLIILDDVEDPDNLSTHLFHDPRLAW
ncbi:probable disease resistance protein At1g59620 [Chenopodium quinoa]|uniref:probable disease resistance protein At1g59620 n=1 Tax=Chenopodium quinoa TaxID=63459 RepID=UPI000B78F992|nr:probable disease resistance protein At1g59620 [Chenopodium quinoa]